VYHKIDGYQKKKNTKLTDIIILFLISRVICKSCLLISYFILISLRINKSEPMSDSQLDRHKLSWRQYTISMQSHILIDIDTEDQEASSAKTQNNYHENVKI
jgi:hypothetical protein